MVAFLLASLDSHRDFLNQKGTKRMNFHSTCHSTRSVNAANVLLAIICAVALAACGGSDTEDSAGGPPAPTEQAGGDLSASPVDTGTGLSGKVTLNGPRPERTVVQTESDEKCAEAHGNEPLLSDSTIVSENGEIKNVFVYIKEAPEGDYPPPAEQVVLDQVGCRYIPHVLGVQLGQELSIENSDPMLHNVRAFARKNRPFNNTQIEGAPPRVKKFKNAEMAIRMKCDIHPWMTAFLFAMDHPFFAVTDESGAYTIEGLPAGDYTLVAWHEKYGEQETTITITEGEGTAADFTFEPEA